jgi:hypothetical protein
MHSIESKLVQQATTQTTPTAAARNSPRTTEKEIEAAATMVEGSKEQSLAMIENQ